ncbi:hypothetical protein Tco_1192373 [Tanacetum coccineum]
MEILLVSSSNSTAVDDGKYDLILSSVIFINTPCSCSCTKSTQRIKVQESRKLKFKQSKYFRDSDIQNLPSRYQDYQDKDFKAILLASFQDDAKYEYVCQNTRSQDGKEFKEKRFKDLGTKDQVKRQ